MQFKRVSHYIQRARTILGDVEVEGDTTRWLTTDLEDFLNDAVEHIATNYRLMRETKLIELSALTPDYDFTEFAYDIIRAEYTPVGGMLQISHHELDRLKGVGWLLEVGTPTHLVFDKSNVGKLRVYPMPDNEQVVTTPLDKTTPFIGELGLVILEDGSAVDLIDIIQTDSSVTLDVKGTYGILSLVSIDLVVPNLLKLYYNAKKPQYTGSQGVEVDSRLVRPIIDYIVSEALALGIDSENRDLSAKYRLKFDGAVAMLDRTVNSNGSEGILSTVPYNNGFNLEDPRGASL